MKVMLSVKKLVTYDVEVEVDKYDYEQNKDDSEWLADLGADNEYDAENIEEEYNAVVTDTEMNISYEDYIDYVVDHALDYAHYLDIKIFNNASLNKEIRKNVTITETDENGNKHTLISLSVLKNYFKNPKYAKYRNPMDKGIINDMIEHGYGE